MTTSRQGRCMRPQHLLHRNRAKDNEKICNLLHILLVCWHTCVCKTFKGASSPFPRRRERPKNNFTLLPRHLEREWERENRSAQLEWFHPMTSILKWAVACHWKTFITAWLIFAPYKPHFSWISMETHGHHYVFLYLWLCVFSIHLLF